jgi:Putative transposase
VTIFQTAINNKNIFLEAALSGDANDPEFAKKMAEVLCVYRKAKLLKKAVARSKQIFIIPTFYFVIERRAERRRAEDFIRRFLMHVLPSGFHRIRYYGFLTCQTRAENIERIRELLAVPLIPLDDIKAASAKASTSAQPEEPKAPVHPCPCCGSNMRIIETFLRGQQPKHKPTPVPPKIKIDTS